MLWKESKLKAARMHIYVRRGGPNYQTGLKKMRALGEELGVPLEVWSETFLALQTPYVTRQCIFYSLVLTYWVIMVFLGRFTGLRRRWRGSVRKRSTASCPNRDANFTLLDLRPTEQNRLRIFFFPSQMVVERRLYDWNIFVCLSCKIVGINLLGILWKKQRIT